MSALRGEPADEVRYQDLGTVVVTCPSESESGPSPYGYNSTQVGGCSYEWAVARAEQRAAAAGADGIHSISTAVNTSGKIVNLTASAFVYLPRRVPPPETAPAPPAAAPSETVEERLKHLEKLRADQLVTPEEYAKKRAEILDDI